MYVWDRVALVAKKPAPLASPQKRLQKTNRFERSLYLTLIDNNWSFHTSLHMAQTLRNFCSQYERARLGQSQKLLLFRRKKMEDGRNMRKKSVLLIKFFSCLTGSEFGKDRVQYEIKKSISHVLLTKLTRTLQYCYEIVSLNI